MTKSTKMKKLLPALLFLHTLPLLAQKTEWWTETQTEFIDISGLFGLREPAQVTGVQYKNKRMFIDGFHSFSWKEPGKTIQTFFGAGYTFSFDSTNRKTISIKNDFAFNRVADNGSFLRPMLLAKWKVTEKQTLHVVSWLFLDTRRAAVTPLNGGTIYLSHVYSVPFKKIQLRNELRVLFVRINEVRGVAGAVNQLKISNNKQMYVLFNIGYSFYRSDNKTELVSNAGIGKNF